MRMITIVSLGASAALGLAALFVAKTVLPNTAVAKPVAASVAVGAPVVVAAKDIKYGDKLDAGMLTLVRMPANAAPQGAFSTVEQVLSQDHGGAPVALQPIAAHEALLPIKLSGPGARPSVAAEIAEGMRAYTIKVNDVAGVGGHALPGDRVDVVLMRDLTPTAQNRTYVSDVVLQNVRVLGVDLNADLSSNKPAEPKNATLEVSVEDAQKLSIAATLGALSLALRRTGAADAEPVRMLATRDFVAGGGSPHEGHRGHASVRSGSGLITIVEYSGGGHGHATPAAAAPAALAAPSASASASASAASFTGKSPA
ncbi:Flp pilus assembly protein CpaB [Phenylobacterium sp.]|uniref:Flp pilus assembly protein CpaB n=1 Tax=Phenylobacterium sp. TaxID=1871053 RepID=UPI002DE56CE0|nr:Flp pilus assembly protein CpaB [Phenylobacterium sp.]